MSYLSCLYEKNISVTKKVLRIFSYMYLLNQECNKHSGYLVCLFIGIHIFSLPLYDILKNSQCKKSFSLY